MDWSNNSILPNLKTKGSQSIDENQFPEYSFPDLNNDTIFKSQSAMEFGTTKPLSPHKSISLPLIISKMDMSSSLQSLSLKDERTLNSEKKSRQYLFQSPSHSTYSPQKYHISSTPKSKSAPVIINGKSLNKKVEESKDIFFDSDPAVFKIQRRHLQNIEKIPKTSAIRYLFYSLYSGINYKVYASFFVKRLR